MNHSRVRPPRQALAWLVIERGLDDAQIAELCGVPLTVRRWRHDDHIFPPPKAAVTREEVYDLYVTQQLSMDKVGRKLGRSKEAVRVLLRRYGIPPRQRGWIRGRHQPRLDHLPDNQDLKRAYETGWTITRLAAHHHVHPTTIHRRLKAAGTTFRPRGPQRGSRQSRQGTRP